MRYALMIVAAVICVLLPVGPALAVGRRLGARYRLLLWGALTFALSQVVHIPLNLGVGALYASGTLPTPPAPVTAWLLPLALGLSAGLCEEPARWLAMRRLPEVRPWGSGVMLGLGHGGLEALLVGVSILGTAVTLLVIQRAGMDTLGIPAEQQLLVQSQLDAVMQAPPWTLLLGAVERAFALTCHVAMSLLVMQAHRSGRLAWLGAAIGFHTVLNAGAVALVQRGHPYLAEVWIGGMAVAAVGIAVALRRVQAR